MAAPSGNAARVWQRMLSGRRLDLMDPAPVDVEIEDIAHGLARVARWNGQTVGDHAFSVAQHSVLVLEIVRRTHPSVPMEQQMMVLLHDAPEYVIGDMISPFKAIIGTDYKAIEQRLLTAIHLRFGLPAEAPETWRRRTKRADRIAAYHEATRLAGFGIKEAQRFFGKPGPIIVEPVLTEPQPPREAQRCFLDAFTRIEKARTRS